MVNLSTEHRVLYLCSRLPGTVQSGLDLRIQGQILSLLASSKVSVFGLNGKSKKFDDRIYAWSSSADPFVSQEINAEAGIRALGFGGHPFAARFSARTAVELSQEILSFRPTHVIISRIDLTVYLETIQEVFAGRIILDLDESVDSTGPSIQSVISHPGQRLVFKTFSERVRAEEESSFKKVEQVWVSSDVELNRAKLAFKSDYYKFSTVPNSVRVETYGLNPDLVRESNTLIYPASFAYAPSIDAAKFLIHDLMPLIPELKLKFVGSHIPEWMRDSTTGNISVEGPVTDMVPHLQTASVLVVPLRAGGGTRLKVIESMASGLPVVSTAFGVEGLGLVEGEHYLRAETPREFADQCRLLVSNRVLWHRLSERGMATVGENFSIQSLEDITSSLISRTT